MTGVYTELENVYAGKSVSPLQGGSSAEPEGLGQTEAYGRSLSPLTLPPLTGTLGLTHAPKHSIACTHTMCTCFHQWFTIMCPVGLMHLQNELSKSDIVFGRNENCITLGFNGT